MDITMYDLFALLGYEQPNRLSVNLPCPAGCPGGCPSKKRKFNVNFQKNVSGCAKGGIGGGILWTFAVLTGIPYEDAAKQLFKKQKCQRKSTAPAVVFKKTQEAAAPLAQRSATYKALFSMLPLSNRHLLSLATRGFSEVTAKRHYRSYPTEQTEAIAHTLQQLGCTLAGVPGFYINDKGNWQLRELGSGILIPQVNADEKIMGLQVRLDQGNTRFLTLSSADRKGGCKAKAYPSYRQGSIDTDTLILTEGPMKGDLITHLSHRSTLALQGVNCTGTLPGILQQLRDHRGIRKVCIAFDMDLLENPHVAKAADKIGDLVAGLGLTYLHLRWNPKYKGLDDYYAAITTQHKNRQTNKQTIIEEK